ncbi:type III pantothenate kinase [Bermanella sp. R86510]|uniref:type III pantothenate kinase n=1 Tax=unclassified Bermanella TaxID=2627862 RepID=UPI0037C8EF41
MRLELDAGNTRTKWRLLSKRGEVVDMGQDLAQALNRNQITQGDINQVWVSSVSGEQNDWIKQCFPFAEFAQVQVSHGGLSNSYSDPHKMGVDRWLAMLAVWHRQPRKAHIVVDAGTALTMDIVDEFGRHVGGYICPGLDLMKTSLLGATHKVKAEHIWQAGRAPGINTQMCVDYGIQDMAVSWIEKHSANQPSACLWLTGGAAQQIVPLFEKPIKYEQNLVLDGLQVYFG